MSDNRHIRAVRAYAATKARRGLSGAAARLRHPQPVQTDAAGADPTPRQRPASDADTMAFARHEGREDWRERPRRPSPIAQGFGFGLGFAAGTGLFRVVMFLILFGGLMLVLLSLAASVL